MIRQRISTLVTTMSLVLSLSAVSVAMPATTFAALPDVHTGYGTYDTQLADTGASPTEVAPGNYAAFAIWAFNHDTSTISQFYLTQASAGTVYSVTWSKSDGAQKTCKVTVPLNCAFGQLRPGAWIDALVVIQVPDSGISMPVQFVWSTVGVGHGYTFPVDDTVSLNDSDDFDGTYVVNSGTPVANHAVGTGNAQSINAVVPNAGIPASVEDGADFTPDVSTECTVTDTFDCTGFWGEWSSVNVDNNTDFAPAKIFITITIDAATVPSGVNKNNIEIYHQYQDEFGFWHEEIIPKGCGGGTLPCFTLTTTKSLWTLVIQTTHNGNFRNI